MQGLFDATPDPHKLLIMDIGEVTVLIVDDEALARAAMRRALRPLSPLRILQAETGASSRLPAPASPDVARSPSP